MLPQRSLLALDAKFGKQCTVFTIVYACLADDMNLSIQSRSTKYHSQCYAYATCDGKRVVPDNPWVLEARNNTL